MEILFENWNIQAPRDGIPQQYDNGVWELTLAGELPEGWNWQALLAQGENLDVIELAGTKTGASAVLSAENLALSGPYTIQIRGTKGEQVRHTNLVQVYVPRSLSGDEKWPELPTEFSQMEAKLIGISEHPPVPGENGYWKIWDASLSAYVQSEIAVPAARDGAPGEKGDQGPAGETGPGAEVYYINLVGAYPNYTCGVSMDEIAAAYNAGKVVRCRCAMGSYTADLPLFLPLPSAQTWVFSGSGGLSAMGFFAQSLTVAIVAGTVMAENTALAKKEDIPEIPEALKNPNALTIKVGDTTVTYDGSDSKMVEIPKLVDTETVTAPAYTNQIPLSVDASGAVYNGTGYKSGVYLNSAGEELSGSGVATSGYIPVKKGDIIRIKDTSQAGIDTTLTLALTAAKAGAANCGKTIANIQGGTAYGKITVSGNEATWDTSGISYYFWNDFAWLRVTTHSADAVVTVNEAIQVTTTTREVLKENVKVKAGNLDFDVGKPILSGKKAVCFGDSIFGMIRDTTSVPAWAAAFTGATVYNVGFGGCRMAVHPTSGYAAFSMWALADAVATGSYTTQDAQAASGQDYFASQLAVLKSIDFGMVDAVVIHYGTNDFASGVTFDNGDNDADTATLCGALRYAVRKLLGAYPKLRIFVSLPLYRMWGSVGAETYTNANGKKLREACTALADAAGALNLPVIDGYKALGVNSINGGAYLSDGTHLTDHGRRAFGEYIGGCLVAPK